MYHKAILFDDPELAEKVLNASNPALVKKLGRRVQNFDPKKWEAHRLEIVRRGNLLKFTQNPVLKHHLLATGDKTLVEASPFDKIWGIGKRESKAIEAKASWGLNLLGEALMQVRKQLKEEQESKAPEEAV